MKIKITIVAMTLLMAVCTAFGADIDGKWTGKYDSGMGGDPMNMEYTFKADGDKLTGTTIGGANGEQIAIKNGKIDGDKISFSVSVDMMGQEMSFDYKGELKGDKLKLKFDMGGQGGGDFTVSRAK
jgi:hypothetical protein